MAKNRGYHSYHGRTSGKKIALIVVMVLLLVVSGAYLLLQDYIIYESDGSITLDLPFFQNIGKDKDDGKDEDNLPIEIIDGDKDPDGDEDSDDEKDPGGDVTENHMTGTTLSAADLCQGGYSLPSDTDTIVVEMKGFNGMFAYDSRQATSQAVEKDSVSQSEVSQALEGEERKAVARVGCFHDSFHAYADMAGAGICQRSGFIWYDNLRSHWMDPSKEGTVTYMAAVLKECASMGFDEILLTDFTYPTEGSLSGIDYSYMTVSKSEALLSFLKEMQEAVEIPVSVELSQEQILKGADDVSGVDPAAIAAQADRVYVTGGDDQEAVRQALGQDVSIVWVTGSGEDAAYRQ